MLIKVDQKDITLSRLCYYLSESTRGTNANTMFFSPYVYIYIYYSNCSDVEQEIIFIIIFQSSRSTNNLYVTDNHFILRYFMVSVVLLTVTFP